MKAEFQTYSSVAEKGQQQIPDSRIIPRNLVSVVKKIVEEEDQGKNIMMFGLLEEEIEVLNDKVRGVLESIGEKSRVEACTIGKTIAGKMSLPLKQRQEFVAVNLTFQNVSAVSALLMRGKCW